MYVLVTYVLACVHVCLSVSVRVSAGLCGWMLACVDLCPGVEMYVSGITLLTSVRYCLA